MVRHPLKNLISDEYESCQNYDKKSISGDNICIHLKIFLNSPKKSKFREFNKKMNTKQIKYPLNQLHIFSN